MTDATIAIMWLGVMLLIFISTWGLMEVTKSRFDIIEKLIKEKER